MTEILLNKTILFDKGYVLQTLNNLSINISYYLKIQANNITYNRIYVPMYNNNTILDTWRTMSILQGTDVCFTLTDTEELPCEIPICDFILN